MKLYIRTSKDGKRSWEAIGQYANLGVDGHVITIQVSPGLVYHARFTDEDLEYGVLKKG